MVKDLNDPTNVDSVPAMLTPGEYVLNKEATQMYGPLVHQMNQHGLQQRQAENIQHLNDGGMSAKISKLHGEGYTAPGQAYAIAKSMGYNTGGLVDFLKKHEGWRDKAYQDSAGVWTIGYGRTRNADGSPIKPGQRTSREAEDSWIEQRAAKDYNAVKAWAENTGEDYSPQELEALASFRYNLGPGGFNQLTGNGKRDKATIQKKLPLYNKAGGREIRGLNNRRSSELAHAGWGGEAATTADSTPTVPEKSKPVPDITQTEQPTAPIPESTPIVDQEAPVSTDMGLAGGLGQMALEQLMGGGAHGGAMARTGGGQRILSAEEIRAMTRRQPVMYNQGGPIHMNTGGWLSNLLGWGQDDAQQMSNALAARPGFRNADPLAGALPQPEVPTAAPTGIGLGPMAQSIADWQGISGTGPTLAEKFTNPIGSAPAQLQDIQENTVPVIGEAFQSLNIPLPFSDEAILQGSSQSQDTGVMSGWDQLSQEQFQDEAIPRGVTGGSADPTGQSLESVGAPQLGQELTPEQQEAYNATVEKAQQAQAHTFDAPEAPTPQLSPRLDMKGATPQEKKASVTEVLNNTKPENEADINPQDTKTLETAGKKSSPEEFGKAKSFLKEMFGDLFDKKELARAALLYLGGRATGMSGNGALALAGRTYLGRLDAKASNLAQTKKELVKGGKYTPASIDAFTKSGNAADLIPTAGTAGANRKLTGQTKRFYQPGTNNQIQATQYEIDGIGKVWVDERTGQRIPPNWTDDGKLSTASPEYTKQIQDWDKANTDVFKSIQAQAVANRGGEKGSNIVGLNPELVGPQVTKWAMANGLDPASAKLIMSNAYEQALASGKSVKTLEPYLNQQYIETLTPDISLFETANGKPVEAGKAKGFIDNLTNQAKQANPEAFGNMSPTEFSSWLMGSQTAKDWRALDEDDKKEYAKNGGKVGMSGFMWYIQQQMLQ